MKKTIVALACIGLSPAVQVVSAAPDGGYPGQNTAEGQSALLSLTTGTYDTAVGWFALKSNTTGRFTTATGAGALLSNNIAISNTANGAFALFNNDSTGHGVASWNSAFGTDALFSNTDGFQNSAFGESALFANTTGHYNTAIGDNALRLNQTGSGNTAVGYFALYQNTADGDTAVGFGALAANTTGDRDAALGFQAMNHNIDGSTNTAVGYQALYNGDNSGNTAIGHQALYSGGGGTNTAVGLWALYSNASASSTAVGVDALVNSTTGGLNTALGYLAGSQITTAANVVCIHHPGANVNHSCFIGNIRGITTQNNDSIPVVIDSFGQLGTMSSSRQFKDGIKPMDKASEAVLALKPVTFHYKNDNTKRPEFGLIAEQVAKVNPDLVVRDKNGDIYTVRYDAVNAMLLNEFLKEHRTVQKQQKEIDALKAELREQKVLIQKVNARLEMSEAAPQVAENN